MSISVKRTERLPRVGGMAWYDLVQRDGATPVRTKYG